MANDIPASIRIIRGANRTLGRVAPSLASRLSRRIFSTPRKFTPREWELSFEAMATRQRLASGLSVLCAGDGPLVALIHGWEGRATQFATLAPALLARGFSVVAIDAPGHGHSRGKQSDPYRFAEALIETSTQVGPLYAAVGHSMGGGSIALALSSGLPLGRAALIASPSSLHDVLHRFSAAMHLPPKAADHFVRDARRRIEARGYRTDDLEGALRSVQVPALVVHALDDQEVPFADAERIAGFWPGAVLLPVEDVGHRRILRDPVTITAIADFLSAGHETGR
ncbi:alpha/beta fold hydrolase [Gemmatimonas sp.]|uniref:alpha/beta fold hydrolase n=1 Tax=Gemmatimonas sp. TaxID=1962908 RepID=UPI00398300D5